MVTYIVKKMMTRCSPMIEQFLLPWLGYNDPSKYKCRKLYWATLQCEAHYRFHQTKIFDTFLTLFDWGAGFFRQFEIYARMRLEITATFLNNHRRNFQEIRENSWSGGNGSALRAVKRWRLLTWSRLNFIFDDKLHLLSTNFCLRTFWADCI